MDAVNAFNGEVRFRVLFAVYRLPLAERARQAPPKQSLFISNEFVARLWMNFRLFLQFNLVNSQIKT